MTLAEVIAERVGLDPSAVTHLRLDMDSNGMDVDVADLTVTIPEWIVREAVVAWKSGDE